MPTIRWSVGLLLVGFILLCAGANLTLVYRVVMKRERHSRVLVVPGLAAAAGTLVLPLGCVTSGKTVAEIEATIREAIELHIEGLREDGVAVPEPSTVACEVEIDPVA